MVVKENEAGGLSAFIDQSETLRVVPKSHRALLTPELRQAFRNPEKYLQGLIERCPFPAMEKWLTALLESCSYQLELHQGEPPQWTEAGITWFSDEVCSARITPALAETAPRHPEELKQYYRLVDKVSWMPFGLGGGMYKGAVHQHPSVEEVLWGNHPVPFDPTKAFVFGSSFCGDMLIYTLDGRGGWMCHENCRVHLLGSISDTINWIYSELQARRHPEFDYENWL